MHLPVEDITCHPPGTEFAGVRSPRGPMRPWLESLPSCAALATHHILHVGNANAPPGYRIVRTRQTTGFFFATLSGEGRVLVHGKWEKATAGTACLLPSFILNAFETTGDRSWRFCWVCREEPGSPIPESEAIAPIFGAYDPAPLHHAVAGLRAESLGPAGAAMQYQWTELIYQLVIRFARGAPSDRCFANAWIEVAGKLGMPWSVENLAHACGCSREKLRRLCSQHFGRSPMQQVAHLRLRRAASLLAGTADKLETIARDVGYGNGFILSKAFLKWSGIRPSEFREKKPPLAGVTT